MRFFRPHSDTQGATTPTQLEPDNSSEYDAYEYDVPSEEVIRILAPKFHVGKLLFWFQRNFARL